MKKCVVPISGGLDSTVILHHAKKTLGYDDIYCVSFDYGQRHVRELECADYQCNEVDVTEHKVLDISFVKDIVTTSSLTNPDIDVPTHLRGYAFVHFTANDSGREKAINTVKILRDTVVNDIHINWYVCMSIYLMHISIFIIYIYIYLNANK